MKVEIKKQANYKVYKFMSEYGLFDIDKKLVKDLTDAYCNEIECEEKFEEAKKKLRELKINALLTKK